MISKIFSSSIYTLFKSNSIVLSNSFNFCTRDGQKYEPHPLRNKIVDLASFDDFSNFFKEKKNEFDSSCYSIAARTLAKILVESRLNYKHAHRQAIKNFLNSVLTVNIDQLNLVEYSHLLYLLRVIKQDPNNNNLFVGPYSKSIFERSENKLKELEQDSSLNRLCYFYQELCGLNSKSSNSVARRIGELIKSTNEEVQSQNFKLSDINLVLKGMKWRSQLSIFQIQLLKIIIKTINQKFLDNISFLELAQVSVGVNEVLSNNITDLYNFGDAELIHQKVLANIDEMDEKSIICLLNSSKTNNRTYHRIYKVIFQKIFDEIQPNGDSSFNELFTLRLFNGISNKIKLHSTSEENQEKFFTFFKKTISKTPRFINSFVEFYVEKGFFNRKNLAKLLQILENMGEFGFRLNLLYELTIRGVNVQKLYKIGGKQFQLYDKNLIIMGTILSDLIQRKTPNQEKYKQLLAKLKQKFFELYKVEDESFSSFINFLESKYFRPLGEVFRKDIEIRLPSPYETQQSQKYKRSWLKYIIFAMSERQFATKHSLYLRSRISKEELEFCLKISSTQKQTIPQTISNKLTLASKCLDLIFAHDELIDTLSRLMMKSVSQTFHGNDTDVIKIRYWHILHQSIDRLPSEKFISNFFSIVTYLLKSDSPSLKFSDSYVNLVEKLLKKSKAINSKTLCIDLLKEGLRLHLISRELISQLGEKIIEFAPNNQKLMLKMIEKNQFLLKDTEIVRENLHLFLYNHSTECIDFLAQNQQKVQGIIEKLKPRDIWRCVSFFRLGARKNVAYILNSLFTALLKFNISFEHYSPIYLIQSLKRNNYIRFGYISFEQPKQFVKKAIEYFSQINNIQKLSLADHIQLMKQANEIKVKSDEYCHFVWNYYNTENSIHVRQLVLTIGLLGIEVNQRELDKLIVRNLFSNFTSSFSKCFTIFLLFEKQFEKPATVLKTLIDKYNQLKDNEKVPVFALYHEYLKKTYPEETKDWQPNHVQKSDFCRSLDSINSSKINFMRQVFQEVCETKWIENLTYGNYSYTFRNLTLVFPGHTKYHGQNQLIKKVLKALGGYSPVVIINKNHQNLKTMVKYLTINYPNSITSEEEAKIFKKISEELQKNVKIVEEEAEVVESEVKAQGQNIKTEVKG